MNSSVQIADSHKPRVTSGGDDSYAFVRMYHSPPAAHHAAFFEMVRAGDERKPHPYDNSNMTTFATTGTTTAGAGAFTSGEGISPNLASSSSRRALRREENAKALHRVLLQSWCDNEEVERRIILEREITERHQIVVGGLNSATNASYKSLRAGPLSMTVEERAGLRVHPLKTRIVVDTDDKERAVVEGKKSSPSNNNNNNNNNDTNNNSSGNGAKMSAGGEEADDEFTDLLHSLSADEKRELKAIFDSDTKLAVGLVELYKKMVEERKVLSFKPTSPLSTTTTTAATTTTRQHESSFSSFSSQKVLLPSSSASSSPPQSTIAHNNKNRTEQKRTVDNKKEKGKAKNENAAAVTQRDVLVQSLITSMNEVLPAELLGLISYDADRESMELKLAEAAITREQQNENVYHYLQMESTTLNSRNNDNNNRNDNSYHLGRPDAEDSAAAATTSTYSKTKSSLNPPCSSAREISDSVYYLYKTLGDFYQRVRSVEARYLVSKWEKMVFHTKRQRKRREEERETEEDHGNMERKEDLTTSSVIRVPQTHFVASDSFPVTPSSVILVSFFTRLFNLDDPLAHTNFIDLLKTKHFQHGVVDGNIGGGGGGAFHEPTVVKNEFYALPRQDRVLDIPSYTHHTERGGDSGESEGTLIPRFSSASASAAQIGALLLDEAAQVVTEFPDAKPLAYDTYGSLGKYNSAVFAESAEAEQRLKTSASGVDQSSEESYTYPCSLDVVDALPYTAFTSYLRTICGALYPDRSPLVASQILAAALLRRAHLLLIF